MNSNENRERDELGNQMKKRGEGNKGRLNKNILP